MTVASLTAEPPRTASAVRGGWLAPLPGATGRRGRARVWGLPLVGGLLALYLTGLLLIRLALSPSLTPDEADLALFSQSLAWGYSEQPPLYSWLVWVAVRVFGLNIFSLTLVRLLLLGSVHLALYALARRLPGARLAPLTCFSLFLLPVFAWNAANYLTHTLLLCAVFLATVRQVLLLPRRRHARSYALLGLWLGLGLLSKYNGALFAAALLLAALGCPRYRACLADRRLLLTLTLATVLVLPHGLWVLHHGKEVWGLLAFKMSGGQPHTLAGTGRGLWSLLRNVSLLLLPLVAGLGLLLRPRRGDVRPVGDGPAGCRLLERFFLTALALLALLPLVGGSHNVHERWLQPLVVLAPAYCFARLRWRSICRGHLRLCTGAVVALVLAVLVGLASRIVWGSRDEGIYPLQMSFDALAQRGETEGIDAATLVVPDRTLGGNLRLRFPRACVYCACQACYRPPLTGQRPCFAVWNARFGRTLPPRLAACLGYGLFQRGDVRFVTVAALMPGRPSNLVGYVRLVRTGCWRVGSVSDRRPDNSGR